MNVETINVYIVDDINEAWAIKRQAGDIVLIREQNEFIGVTLDHGDHMFSQPLSREQALAVAFEELHKWNQYVDDQLGPDWGCDCCC